MTDASPFRAFRGRNPMQFNRRDGENEFTGWQDEQWGWKNTAYIGDWSFVPAIRVTGPEALKVFSDTSVNSFAKFPIGKAKHAVQCDENGKVITEGVLIRHGEEDFEFNATTPQWTLFKIKTEGYEATATFPDTHKLQVSGPRALELLQKLTGADLTDVPFMATKEVEVDGYPVLALRQGMAGDIGFELHGPISQRRAVYDAVLRVGEEFGIRQRGWRWQQINHLESYFPTSSIHYLSALAANTNLEYVKFMDENLPQEWVGTWLEGPLRYAYKPTFGGSWDGTELEGLYRSPVELGWSRYIKFDHKFLGDEALRAELADQKRTGVTLEFNSDDMIKVYASLFAEGDTYHLLEVPHSPYVVNWVDRVLVDGKEVGHSVFPGYSTTFKKVLSLGFIDLAYSGVGTEVKVLWGNPDEPQIELRATVSRAPYKQDDRRRDLAQGAGVPVESITS